MSSKTEAGDSDGSCSSCSPSQRAQRLAKLLAPYRKGEAKEHLAIIVDDHNAIRLISAWRDSIVEWRNPKKKKPIGSAEIWDWIWSSVLYDGDLATRAKLGETECRQLLSVLVGSRLIYPDTTISEYAAQLVSDHVDKRYPGSFKGRAKGQKDVTQRKRRGRKS